MLHVEPDAVPVATVQPAVVEEVLEASSTLQPDTVVHVDKT